MGGMVKARIQSYAVTDVETGGLLDKGKLAFIDVALTEVAFVIVSPELDIVEKYSSLIKPYLSTAEYGVKAAEVSGITKEDCIKEGKPPKEVVEDIIELATTLKVGKAKPVLVGHNLREYDSYFLENLFIFCGKNLYDYFQPILIDTLEESWKLFPEAPDYKLGTMCGQFGIELVEAHRALPDTISNAELWIAMLKRLRGGGEGGDTVIEVERLRHKGEFKY